MAQIANVSNSLFDSMLPTYGNPRNNLPVWDDSQKMFISSEYESASGNRYYKGLRFCDQLVIVETVGLYHTWAYIDGVEIYTFDGQKLKLIGKRQYNKVFYDSSFIKAETEDMVGDYLRAQIKLQNKTVSSVKIEEEAKKVVAKSYVSFLSDDFDTRMQPLLPLLCASNR